MVDKKMVNIGDIIQVVFAARASFTDLQPVQDPATALRQRLEQSGLKVLSVDTGELGTWTSIESAITLGYAGWGNVVVVVSPLSSAFAQPQDIAGLVAGAAEAIGLQVDNANATATLIATAGTAATSYQQNQTVDDPTKHTSFLDTLAGTLGISKTTLELGIGAGLVVGLIAFVGGGRR